MSSQASTFGVALRTQLQRVAAEGATITYQALVAQMQLQPPNTIRQLTSALEQSMREDAAASHPFIAALVVSKRPPHLPRLGFFQHAAELGRFGGSESESGFHARELAEAHQFWGRSV